MIAFKSLDDSQIDSMLILMKEFYSLDNYPFDLKVSEKVLLEFINNTYLGKAWLIIYDGEIVGYVILTFIFSFEYQGRIAFLDELYLIETARRKGIGSQTLLFIKTVSHKLSLKLIYLELEQHNIKAEKLYLRNGFEMHNRKIMKYKI
jgi:GNAT superfamily N-acetyltransferase